MSERRHRDRPDVCHLDVESGDAGAPQWRLTGQEIK